MAARQLKLGLRVRDLDRSHRLYLRLGFYGLDPDGYEVMFEQFHAPTRPDA
ncbi:hypothetical protein V6U82_00520 [Micromonospora sp. CPCC 205554]